MRLFLVLLTLALEIQLHFTESHAELDSSANNVAMDGKKLEGQPKVVGPVREILAQKGGTATLPCKLNDPGAGIITWVRRRDRQILTVGASTYSMDKRFIVKQTNSEWSLLIHKVTNEDAGLYECQLATHPKVQSNFVRLSITEAYSMIPGAPDLHVKQGSNLRLECQLMLATEAPLYVFWYRNARMINYDSEPGVKVELTKSGSVLEVAKTQLSHGGNYTCSPSNARNAYVMVHVLEEEEKPAAMHGGDRRNLSPAILASNFLVSVLAAVSWRIPSYAGLYPT